MKKVCVLMAQGVEECEALMVVDCLRRVNIEVDMVSIDDCNEIVTSHNIRLCADLKLSDIQIKDYDMVVIPGGKGGVDNLASSQAVSDAIHSFASLNRPMAAICAGPSVLSRLGLLDGKNYTVYPGFEGFSSLAHYTNTSLCVDGNFITANGLGAEFEFVYKIIETLEGKDKAQAMLDQIQYRKVIEA